MSSPSTPSESGHEDEPGSLHLDGVEATPLRHHVPSPLSAKILALVDALRSMVLLPEDVKLALSTATKAVPHLSARRSSDEPDLHASFVDAESKECPTDESACSLPPTSHLPEVLKRALSTATKAVPHLSARCSLNDIDLLASLLDDEERKEGPMDRVASSKPPLFHDMNEIVPHTYTVLPVSLRSGGTLQPAAGTGRMDTANAMAQAPTNRLQQDEYLASDAPEAERTRAAAHLPASPVPQLRDQTQMDVSRQFK